MYYDKGLDSHSILAGCCYSSFSVWLEEGRFSVPACDPFCDARSGGQKWPKARTGATRSPDNVGMSMAKPRLLTAVSTARRLERPGNVKRHSKRNGCETGKLLPCKRRVSPIKAALPPERGIHWQEQETSAFDYLAKRCRGLKRSGKKSGHPSPALSGCRPS